MDGTALPTPLTPENRCGETKNCKPIVVFPITKQILKCRQSVAGEKHSSINNCDPGFLSLLGFDVKNLLFRVSIQVFPSRVCAVHALLPTSKNAPFQERRYRLLTRVATATRPIFYFGTLKQLSVFLKVGTKLSRSKYKNNGLGATFKPLVFMLFYLGIVEAVLLCKSCLLHLNHAHSDSANKLFERRGELYATAEYIRMHVYI